MGRTTACVALALTMLSTAACKPSGPPSGKTTSAGITTLAARVKTLHEYVKFQRTYETLDFDIDYHNNGGGLVPGPSDWDIRIVATVPASQLSDWIPAGATPSSGSDTEWLKTVPTALDLSGVTEWYVQGSKTVGLDRARRIVVYRVSTL